ncbi:MAG: cystathionine gamma-synthase [Thermoflavifilum sp.]|nr:cystathionine gamma-synthase [Thermoflavifilum sp.]
MQLATKLIHAGVEPDPSTGAIMTPIYQTSTYVQQAPGKHKGYEYARTQNPTRTVLEKAMAAIENGSHGIAFSSGMAAIEAILHTLHPGDRVIASNDLYGGSYRLFTRLFAKYGIQFQFVDLQDASRLEQVIDHQTKLIWVETPTNPLLRIVDIQACAEIAHAHRALLCVDNTFASPWLQHPLDLGADIVVHSATKYLGGHSDVVLGVVVVKDAELADQLHFIQNSVGAVPGPHDCWLVLRGLKTLHVRMQRHCENARQIAHYLRQHPKVKQVNWCGFTDHPNHEIARKQMRDYGAMMSFTLHDDRLETAHRVLSSTQLFALAESLGGVESLIGHPASMTHASIPREERIKAGLSDSLIRLSVGIEDINDLIADLEQALQKA